MEMNQNKKYWSNRAKKRDKLLKKREDKVIKEINKIYGVAFADTINDILAFYTDYVDEDGILTMEEAFRVLDTVNLKKNTQEIKALKELYDEYGDENIIKEMKYLLARNKVTRISALRDKIDTNFIMASATVNKILTDEIESIYQDEYKDVTKELGLTVKELPKKTLISATTMAWSGMNFSSRIWKNKAKVVSFLEEIFVKELRRGTDIRKIARNGSLRKLLRDTEKNVRFNTERLVRTEANYAQTSATLEGYRRSKLVNAVEILTAGDDRMCGTCADRGGVVVRLENAIEGDTVPPFH
jgi:DNA-directed RNA polymerase subunit H (RpoH/RPB5)